MTLSYNISKSRKGDIRIPYSWVNHSDIDIVKLHLKTYKSCYPLQKNLYILKCWGNQQHLICRVHNYSSVHHTQFIRLIPNQGQKKNLFFFWNWLFRSNIRKTCLGAPTGFTPDFYLFVTTIKLLQFMTYNITAVS